MEKEFYGFPLMGMNGGRRMKYYVIKQKREVFGNVVWHTLAEYASKRLAVASFKRINPKEHYKLIKVKETEVEE